MTCLFCKRSDMDSAQLSNKGYVYRPIVIEQSAPIRFSVDGMCIDCADVVEHFVRSGLKAWREALRHNAEGQMDLFENADLPPIARFLNNRAS